MEGKLANSICRVYQLSQQSLSLLTDTMNLEERDKDFVLTKIGQQNTLEYILLEGICRSFVVNSEGEEITLSFYIAGPISPNITRVDDQSRSTIHIQALTDIEIAVFPNTKLMDLMRTYKEINEWGNRVLQKELQQKVQKELAQASLSARERLLLFRNTYPALENFIPHPYIASYLGITNVSLSRLRGNI